MELRELVKLWFRKWEEGDFENIPIEENFQHTSPYGTIEGKKSYLSVVDANRDAFLGNTFELHDEIYDQKKACVRYTMRSGDFSMEVSDWFFAGESKIEKIVSYYNVGKQVSYEEDLNKP
ncbi:MAG: nuclear transport factor 2 family protein [Candidatus Thorarchaeota archaeon]